MPNLMFENCCFCIELRVGCLIIGYLNLIGSAIATIMSGYVVAAGAAVMSVYGDDPEAHKIGVIILVMGIITLITVGFLLAFVIVLLVGLHKDKPGHVKCYLVYSLIFLVISFILFITDVATKAVASDIIVRILGLLFSTYIILVIRSYYYKMQEKDSNRAPHYVS